MEINEIKDHAEVTTSGFVDFVSYDEELISEEMEGAEWVAGVISPIRIEEVSDLDDVPWALGFFKRTSLMFPLDTWEYVTHPITVFGDRIDSHIDTGFGDCEYFVKVRAAAYLAE